MTAAADPLAALRTVLIADSAVNAITAGRVRCLQLHTDDVTAMPRAVVLLKPAGGPLAPGGGYQQFGRTRVDVICYGVTVDESYDVYLTVYPVLEQLQRVKTGGVLVHSVDVESKGSSGVDPTTQWPTTYSSWLVLAAEIAAA